MSTKANITSTRSSSKPHKESTKKSNSQTRLKIIVRRLPPNLPESVFWQSVQPWVTDDTVSWKVFYPGKFRKKVDKENIPSRAYLLFKNEGYLATFSKEYDGHIFRDKQGNESYAIVEFAPNPKVASEKKKVDNKHATIQQDEDYLSFLASLQDPPEKPEVDMEALLAAAVPPEEPKITPLLAALREQKEHKAVIQDKKILTNDAKAARKAAASSSTATSAHNKQETVPEQSAAAKKGKKGKGKDSGTPLPQTAPPGKGGRNRGNHATTSAHPAGAAPNKNKDVPQSGSSTERPPKKERENEKERSRPVIGLGSRHLKAALSGAGVQVQSANSNASSSSTSNPQPITENAPQSSPISSISTSANIQIIAGSSKSSGGTDAPPPGGHPRGRGGGGREKHGHESKDSSKEGTSHGGRGGGGGGGREKRNRPPSGGIGRGVDAPPPRILTRQDPPPAGMAISEPSGINNQESGNARGGGGRGRGGRRERGS